MPIKTVFPLAFALIFSGLLFAKGSKPSAAEVDNILGHYRRAIAVQAKVKKTIVQEVMGTSNQSEGHFYFSKGRLRLDIEKPDPSIFIYDGKNIWLESRLDDKNVEVSHMKAGDFRKSKSIMAALFDRRDVLKRFKLLKVEDKSGQKVYSFVPRDLKSTEVRSLQISTLAGELHGISYKDQMENEVSFEFSDISKTSVPSDKFSYRPPKGAHVNEI